MKFILLRFEFGLAVKPWAHAECCVLNLCVWIQTSGAQTKQMLRRDRDCKVQSGSTDSSSGNISVKHYEKMISLINNSWCPSHLSSPATPSFLSFWLLTWTQNTSWSSSEMLYFLSDWQEVLDLQKWRRATSGGQRGQLFTFLCF